MLLYIFVALFPLLVGMRFHTVTAAGSFTEGVQMKRYNKKRWKWLFMAALPMFALIAFRDPFLGADTNGYLTFFEQMVDTPWNRIFKENEMGYQFEEGFVLFEKLLTIVTHNPKVYQVIYSTIYLVSVVTFANRLEKNNFAFLYFVATIGLYTFMFTGVRQCLAMCICLWSYPYIKERRLIPFLLTWGLAFTFHKSAILFGAAYIMYNRKLHWINIFFYAAFAIWAALNIDVIQEWFNRQLDFDYEVEETGNGMISFAVITVITAFSLFVALNYKKKTHSYVGLINIGFLTAVLWLLRLVTRVAERPSYYFMFFSAAMLGYALEEIPGKREKLLIKVAAYSLFMALFIYKFLTNFKSFLPYSTFF